VYLLYMYFPTTACAVRAQLASRYRKLLDQHTAALLEVLTADRARKDTQALYESCIEARDALEQHDQSHRCAESKTAQVLRRSA
jgi:hypothetical protein